MLRGRNPIPGRTGLIGWLFPSTAWLVLFNAGLALVFVYGLAASDHHLAERIPTHLHLVSPGGPIPQHVHDFSQNHFHPPHPSLVTAAPGTAFLTLTGPTFPIESWSTGLVVDAPTLPAERSHGYGRGVDSPVLQDQLLVPPLLHPPAGVVAPKY